MNQRKRMYDDYIDATAERFPSHLSSRSVNDTRLTDSKPPVIRIPSKVRVTGGMVEGATREFTHETPAPTPVIKSRIRNRRGKGQCSPDRFRIAASL